MEWILFGLLVWFFYRRSQKKKGKKAFDAAKKKYAKQQQAYEDFMNSLPYLKGDESFSQQVRGEQAYQETINMYGQFLEDHHPGKDEILVMVELEPSNPFDKNAVRVDAGQATIGYIPREEAEEFGNELRALGGRASCSARLYWSPNDERSSITLDVLRPLQIGKKD